MTAKSFFVCAIEGRNTSGGVRVSNYGYTSQTLAGLISSSDENNGLWGLPVAIDVAQPDLLVTALGTNDWQAGTPASASKAAITAVIDQVRMSGTKPGGGLYAGGDAMLLWPPVPDIDGLGKSAPLRADYRQMFYDVSDEKNVPLLDLEVLWGDYATDDAAGYFDNGIHPSDSGNRDIGRVLADALT